jgi:hypothetical protein
MPAEVRSSHRENAGDDGSSRLARRLDPAGSARDSYLWADLGERDTLALVGTHFSGCWA